jgi:hypothetical protein
MRNPAAIVILREAKSSSCTKLQDAESRVLKMGRWGKFSNESCDFAQDDRVLSFCAEERSEATESRISRNR